MPRHRGWATLSVAAGLGDLCHFKIICEVDVENHIYEILAILGTDFTKLYLQTPFQKS